MTLPRRDFLWHALAVCGSSWLAPGSLTTQGLETRSDRAPAAIAAYFGDRADAVRAIGEAYLRQLGHEDTRESIQAAARGTLAVIGRARDERHAIRELVRAVGDDFARGRSVQIDGWILSRTEAEICALTLLARH